MGLGYELLRGVLGHIPSTHKTYLSNFLKVWPPAGYPLTIAFLLFQKCSQIFFLNRRFTLQLGYL